MQFEWDPEKDLENRRKHGVTFEEARSVFRDEHALMIGDPDHSEEEDRFVLVGFSFLLRVLVVCHCYREAESVIRIISARKANKRERDVYARGLGD